MTENINAFDVVYTFEHAKDTLGNSPQSKYISRYLQSLGVKTCIIEKKYIDKDYLIDYSKFYARSFRDHNKFTTRLHFFSDMFTNTDFKNMLVEGDKTAAKKFEESYLGFVVVKPIVSPSGDSLIGRTVLKTYPNEISDNEYRFYISETYHVSLFGIPLKIISLPFQAQDTAVGACATTACWTSLHPLRTLFEVQKDSPFEITEKSVSLPSIEARNFPNSNGLTLLQMKSYFNSIQLETEFIDIEKIQCLPTYSQDYDDVVADAVTAYTNMKLPIIAALGLIKDGLVTDRHATVISGYRHKNGLLNELYIHDDQIGPYSRVKPYNNFINWKNEWIEEYGYTEVRVLKLMVPIYPKLRLNFNTLYQIYLNNKRSLEGQPDGLTLKLYLTDTNSYKKFLWNYCQFEHKEDILSKPFPRFLWIIRLQFREIPVLDSIYDGTSVNPIEYQSITFRHQYSNNAQAGQF